MPTPRRANLQRLKVASPVLFVDEAAAYLRVVTKATLNGWRCRPPKGGGPRYVKTGGQIGYLKEELDRWLRTRQRYTTSDLEQPAAEAEAAEKGAVNA